MARLLTFVGVFSALELCRPYAASHEGLIREGVQQTVVSTRLLTQPPVPLREGSTRGFHNVVHVHGPVEDFPEIEDVDNLPRSATRDYHVVPLLGGMVAVGEYYAEVLIGGQMIRAQIDTGSATLAVPVHECASCRRGDKRYDIRKSVKNRGRRIDCSDSVCTPGKCMGYACGACSSDTQACCARSDTTKCGFHLSFGDGSFARGMLVEDVLTFGDVEFPVVFGGIDEDSPDFERSQVDGILGMAYPALACNPSCVRPTFESMIDHLGMKPVFQICITANSGRIVLGDYDSSIMKGPPTWVDLSLGHPPTYYTVRLKGSLEVNDVEVPMLKYKLGIVDSGTTLIVLARTNFDILVTHITSNYCHIPGLCGVGSWFRAAHCTKIEEEHRRQMPKIRFRMEGFDIVLGPDEYLINYESKGPDYWCVGIMSLPALSGNIDVIFGNTVMKKYVTIIDREKSRVGFAESYGTCEHQDNGKGTSDNLPALVSGEPDKASATTSPPTPATQGGGGHKATASDSGSSDQAAQASGTGNTASSGSSLCGTAQNCTSCKAVEGVSCAWSSTESVCAEGEHGRFMCTVDLLVANTAYVITAGIGVLATLVAIVTCAICTHRKRQSMMQESAVDPVEASEARRPLAENAESIGSGRDDVSEPL